MKSFLLTLFLFLLLGVNNAAKTSAASLRGRAESNNAERNLSNNCGVSMNGNGSPNPTVQFSEGTARVFNMQGIQVMQLATGTTSLGSLSTGTYIVKYECGGITNIKVVVA